MSDIIFEGWRSGTTRAANGEAVLPIVAIVGRIDVAGAVEVEVVGVGARVWSRGPVKVVWFTVALLGSLLFALIKKATAC